VPFDSNGNSTINRQVAVTGQTVLAVQVNVPFDDIQSMLSQCFLRSGVAPMGANLNMASFKIINLAEGTNPGDAVEFSQLADKADELQPYVAVASASTIDLAGAGSENIAITGTATINSFGSAPEGTVRNLVFFSGGATIVYNPSLIRTPSAANIIVVANQSLRAVSLGGSEWRVTDVPQLTAGTGLTSTGTIPTSMTLTVELTQLPAATTLATPRVVVTDGVTAGSSARMVPDDFKKTFEIPGFYTGSNANLTNYPIGTILWVRRDGAAGLDRNQTGNVYYRSVDSRSFSLASVGNTLLSGTWASRGGDLSDFVLMQKIAN